MFDYIVDLANKLAGPGYFIGPVMIQVVFLAAKLQKPLLLEGPAGSGKTQLALSVATAAGTQLAVLRMTDEESVKYRQIAVLGLRRDVRGAAVENNKRQFLSVGLYGSFLGLPELQQARAHPIPFLPLARQN